MASSRRKLTTEVIAASAAQHSKRSAWKRADRSAYRAAAKLGLLNTVCGHMKPVPSSQPFSLEDLKGSAAQYRSRVAWQHGDPSAYNAAKRQGLFDEVCGHMPVSPRKLTLEALIASAAPYKTRGEWKKADQSAYISAYRRGLLDFVCAHMTSKKHPSGYWTLERCKESAAVYSSRKAWSEAAPLAYLIARRNDWVDQCCAHMPTYRRERKWTPERITASAKRFSSKTAWHREEHGAYDAAKRLGIFEQVTVHMRNNSTALGE